jgi:hypothetical protein
MGWLMNKGLERIWKEAVVAYPSICQEGLRKITKTQSGKLVPGPGFEPGTCRRLCCILLMNYGTWIKERTSSKGVSSSAGVRNILREEKTFWRAELLFFLLMSEVYFIPTSILMWCACLYCLINVYNLIQRNKTNTLEKKPQIFNYDLTDM